MIAIIIIIIYFILTLLRVGRILLEGKDLSVTSFV